MASPLDKAGPILNKLIENGHQAYVVGGAVRDLLLNKEVHDVDIATSAHPETVISLFDETVPIGLQHGTVLVLYGGESFEVTTFRSEIGYSDHRHPDQVVFEEKLENDLARRDFTMNAMALDCHGKVIDPFHGEQDLHEKKLVTVGDAAARFKEDPLRMLRAARFTSQLDVCPTHELARAIRKEAAGIRHISIERIRDELTKCLRGVNPYKGLEMIVSTTLYSYINGLTTLVDHIDRFASVDFNHIRTDAERWSLFFYLIDAEVTQEFLKSFRFSRQLTQSIESLLRYYRSEDYKIPLTAWKLYKLGDDLLRSSTHLDLALGKAVSLDSLVQLNESLVIQSRKELIVNGRDLMEWTGKKSGEWIAFLLEDIERKIINKELEHTKGAIQRWVQENG